MWELFKKSETGNVAMMFAILVSLLCVGLGVAIDGNKLVSVNSRASAMADAAALAGAAASEQNPGERESIVKAYIAANEFKLSPGLIAGEPEITFDDETELVTVYIPVQVKLAFGKFLGNSTRKAGSESIASYLKNNVDPVSIAFALDVSGSMGWNASNGQSKIQVLKSATKSLFNSIEAGTDYPDKLKKVIRSGMSAYNTELVSDQPMSWGWSSLESSVDLLVANGGTNSTPALQNSYDQLLNDRAFRKSNDPKFRLETLREYVIFMTDGDNNQPEFDGASQEICQNMKASGIEIYSVAFAAPEKGELLLLDCASPNVANDNAQAGGNDRCMSNGADGNGLALGHCKDIKSGHYFDAEDAASFKAAFEQIGREIVRSNVRLN